MDYGVPQISKLMNWALQFPPDLERDFRAEYSRKSLRPFRMILVVLVGLILFFNLWQIPGYTGQGHMLHVFLIQIPVLLLTYGITYLSIYRRHAQWFHLAIAWFFALDNVRLYIGMPEPEYNWFVTASFMWMTATTYTLGRFRLPFAIAAGLGILVMNIVLVTNLHPMEPKQLVGAIMMPISLNVVMIVATYINERYVRREFLFHRLLDEEKQKSEEVLIRVLPEAIAARLRSAPGAIADEHKSATVLFADIVDFTPYASQANPDEVVAFLNDIFSRFDHLVEKHGLEKIKTVGDAYMVAGGLPVHQDHHGAAVADLALDMLEEVGKMRFTDGTPVRLRIGLHTGPLVAGVIGTKKLLYDLWGDTVNTASRMESHSLPGQIQVTDSVVELLGDQFVFEQRGEVDIKGKGLMPTYFLVGRRK
ncbi:MAG: adenylate/guanylate cyclase domain-containing protein [Fimbriimonadaceae bacterium]|nr:adenylate/guanylate cyclase domain-containing protein [Fimbriimonadaceae bacterium]